MDKGSDLGAAYCSRTAGAIDDLIIWNETFSIELLKQVDGECTKDPILPDVAEVFALC